MKKQSLLTSLIILSLSGYGQKAAIEGTIYAGNLLPLPGINIQIEGSKYITTTDNYGHFFIANILAGNHTLLATGIGYAAKSKTIIVDDGKVVNINLQLNTVTNSLEEVTVTAKQRLAIANTSTLTRTNTAEKDLPQSIQSISRATIDEQLLYRVDEALKNVAGVNLSSSYEYCNFRGFITNSGNFLTNGMKGTLFPEGVANSVSNIESIEVLPGPSAILFGENALGGNINFNIRQPKKITSANAAISTGSFELFRTQAAVTGSINKQKSLYYVAGFGFENGEKQTADWKNTNALLFTAVKWEAGAKTSLQLNANYNYDNSTSNYAIDLPFIKGNVFSLKYH